MLDISEERAFSGCVSVGNRAVGIPAAAKKLYMAQFDITGLHVHISDGCVSCGEVAMAAYSTPRGGHYRTEDLLI